MSSKPLIVHVLYRLDTGGMEHILVSLIHATRDRYRHAVITLAGCGELRREIDDVVEACVSLDKQPGKDWGCFVRFWRALRQLKPDLVQTYNIGTLDLAPIVKLAGVRRVVHAEHGRDVSDPHGDNRKYQRLRRWMAPFIARFIPISGDLQTWLTARVGIAPSKVTYIANGIDCAPFRVERSRAPTRAKLGDFAPPGSVLIGHVARLDKVKDQAGLVQAFKLLRETNAEIDCRLVMAGDGPQRGELQALIEQLGLADRVRLLGNRDDVAELLAEFDVFVLSSIAEGMPVTLLEAMAAGLPVVATDVGGIASVVDNGMTGTLVPSRDPRTLAEALATYAADENLRRQHGEAGCVRVNARFSLDTMAAAYVALYDQLLGRRARSATPATLPGLAGRGER